MNYFFGINNSELHCKITIPKFQNKQIRPHNKYKLYMARIEDSLWKIEKVECKQDNYFYYVDNDYIKKNIFFFLAKIEEIIKFKDNNYKKLLYLNEFTDTNPNFRVNMRIYNTYGGFSSYQSEYPYSMVSKIGSILSPLSSLSNKFADYNKVFLTNIYEKPIKETFELFFVDIVSKRIVLKKELCTNSVNEINIEKNLIKSSIFIFTKKYIGIPVFISSKNNHLSCEHTHPPHDYILSNDKFLKISELKKEVNEIIS